MVIEATAYFSPNVSEWQVQLKTLVFTCQSLTHRLLAIWQIELAAITTAYQPALRPQLPTFYRIADL